MFSLLGKCNKCLVLASIMVNPYKSVTVQTYQSGMKVQIRKTCEFVTEILLHKRHGASRQKQEQGIKQAFQNCLLYVISDFAKAHKLTNPSYSPRLCHPHGFSCLVASHLKAPNTSRPRKLFLFASRLLPLAKVPKSAYYLAHHKEQCKSRVQSQQLKTCKVKDVLSRQH